MARKAVLRRNQRHTPRATWSDWLLVQTFRGHAGLGGRTGLERAVVDDRPVVMVGF
jgi:hypothetical protein